MILLFDYITVNIQMRERETYLLEHVVCVVCEWADSVSYRKPQMWIWFEME